MMAGSFYTADMGVFASRMVHEQVMKNIKDPSVAEWLQPNFSTTTEKDKVVACISIMATLKNYFNYRGGFLCGLPRVTLLGKVEDWIQLRSKIDRLKDFDVDNQMNDWHYLLAKVMDELVKSAQGNDCTDFWDRVIKERAYGSGGDRIITGWASVFCSFSSTGEWIGGPIDRSEKPLIPD